MPNKVKISPCPGGADHKPAMMSMAHAYWIVCPQCGRESYTATIAEKAAEQWAGDVGMHGRSNKIRGLTEAKKIADAVNTKCYPLDIENIGDDVYRLMSRGHHPVAAFMEAVRKDYDWPLGMPVHLWFKAVPDNTGECTCRYVPANVSTRGSFPVTYVSEAAGDACFEALQAVLE